MPFDVAGARAAGYSDAEIADHLAQSSRFNAGQARSAGYSDTEIIDHLTAKSGGPGLSTPPTPTSSAAPARPVPRTPAPEDVPGVGETLLIGAGRTYDRVLDGLTQSWLKMRGNDEGSQAALKANVDDKARLYQPLQEARPVATAVGESLPSMVIPAGGSANLLTTAGKVALASAAPELLSHGTLEERAGRGALAGAAGVVGGVVLPKLAGAAVEVAKSPIRALAGKISPEVQALYQKAQALGIPVSAAQLSDSKFLKTLASVVDNLPFTGSAATKDAQQQAFNRAVSRTIGEDSPKITREVYDRAKTRLKSQFETLSANSNLQVTPGLLSDLGQVESDAAAYGTKEAGRAVKNAIDELLDHIDPSGNVPGKAYQSFDSKMSRLMKSADTNSPYLGQVRDAVRQQFDLNINPADKAAWAEARSQYKNLKAIRDLVAKDGATGDISPTGLMPRLNATQAGKETMAVDSRGDLGTIAQVGKQFVRDAIPNSGTAQRAMALAALGGGSGLLSGGDWKSAGGLALAGLTSGRLANRLLNTPASGAAVAAGSKTLKQLLQEVPSRATQSLGMGAGLTTMRTLDEE